MIVLALPMPPSVNKLYRVRRGFGKKVMVYASPRYSAWKKLADGHLLSMGKDKPQGIKGHFEVSIVLNEKARRGDADNRCKATLDWLQKNNLIENDRFADKVTVSWGQTDGEGCIVTLIPSTREVVEKPKRQKRLIAAKNEDR